MGDWAAITEDVGTCPPTFEGGGRRTVASPNKRSSFYRAMHYSAKRSIAIACDVATCMMMDQEHIGWKS